MQIWKAMLPAAAVLALAACGEREREADRGDVVNPDAERAAQTPQTTVTPIEVGGAVTPANEVAPPGPLGPTDPPPGGQRTLDNMVGADRPN